MAHAFVTKSQNNGWTTGDITHDPAGAATLCCLSGVIGGTTARTGGAPTIDGVIATRAPDAVYTGLEINVEMWYVLKAFDGTAFTISIPNGNGVTCHWEVVTANAGAGGFSVIQGSNG